jgi:prepilin-type processing-associated H-X9-DG protein
MKLRLTPKRNAAMTLFEVGVVVAILFVLALIFLPALAASKRKTSRIGCINNVKQISLSFRLWSGDNNDKYPMDISVTNEGAMEFAANGNVAGIFQVMSNELSTPKILFCFEDANRFFATNFGSSLNAKTISYFVGVDARQATPQMVLVGDDNLLLNGVPVKSGLRTIASNAPVSWSTGRHEFGGNIGLADGSVAQLTTRGLQEAFKTSNSATNRLAIP